MFVYFWLCMPKIENHFEYVLCNKRSKDSTLFENHPKCRIWFFSILAFSINFFLVKIAITGNTVWPQALGFKNSPKLAIFGIFNKLL